MTQEDAVTRITAIFQEWQPDDEAMASAVIGALYRYTIESDESRVRAIMYQLIDKANGVISSV